MKQSRPCPVCHLPSTQAKLFLDENIDKQKLSNFSFSSRKAPEYMCYHLVQCPSCDLVYADQPPEEDELAHAYHVADYDSSDEANDAAAAYILAIRPILERLSHRDSALEIGAGNGVFLGHLVRTGFRTVVGIEPSAAAIAAAPADRQPWIREGMFEEKNFQPESFDLICCFMTMEHVRDPNDIAQAAFRLLRPGGAFAIVTHDYRSVVNRLLGARSPIIDIEHLQLFSAKSARYLLSSNHYQEITVKGFVNSYSLRYWLRLAPLPTGMKNRIGDLFTTLGAAKIKLRFNVGNLLTSGFRPPR